MNRYKITLAGYVVYYTATLDEAKALIYAHGHNGEIRDMHTGDTWTWDV